jgi:DNA-binding NarL/FixJ family response regulator
MEVVGEAGDAACPARSGAPKPDVILMDTRMPGEADELPARSWPACEM